MMATTAIETRIDDRDGWRLSNGAAEAFIIARPYPRVVSFCLKGGESPFRRSVTDPFFGVRTWFLEPTQLDTAPLPALQPAEVKARSDGSLRLTAAVEPATQLQVVQDIALDPVRPVLSVRHGLVNHAPRARRLAAWAINVLPHQGVAVTPWAVANNPVRSLLHWPGIHPGDPALHLGLRALGMDFRMPPACSWLKVGTNTDAGWVAYLWAGGALCSTVPYEAGREYPEGGGSVTIYSSGRTPDQGFSEIENVGPMTEVAPGGTVELPQTLELIPGITPVGNDPDVWLAAIEAARQ